MQAEVGGWLVSAEIELDGVDPIVPTASSLIGLPPNGAEGGLSGLLNVFDIAEAQHLCILFDLFESVVATGEPQQRDIPAHRRPLRCWPPRCWPSFGGLVARGLFAGAGFFAARS